MLAYNINTNIYRVMLFYWDTHFLHTPVGLIKKGATCPCKVCGGCREKRGYCWLPDSTATAQSTAETRTKLAQQQVEVGPTMYVEYTCRNFLLPLSFLLLSWFVSNCKCWNHFLNPVIICLKVKMTAKSSKTEESEMLVSAGLLHV